MTKRIALYVKKNCQRSSPIFLGYSCAIPRLGNVKFRCLESPNVTSVLQGFTLYQYLTERKLFSIILNKLYSPTPIINIQARVGVKKFLHQVLSNTCHTFYCDWKVLKRFDLIHLYSNKIFTKSTLQSVRFVSQIRNINGFTSRKKNSYISACICTTVTFVLQKSIEIPYKKNYIKKMYVTKYCPVTLHICLLINSHYIFYNT